MKAMIMSDLLIAKKYLLQQLGVSIAVGIFITVVIGNLYVAAPMVGVMIPFSLTITILALDERANWQQFRLALPMSRSNVIAGRYVSFALLALLGIAAGLLVTLVMVAVAQIAPGVPQLADSWGTSRGRPCSSRPSPDWPSSWSCCPSRCPCSRGSA